MPRSHKYAHEDTRTPIRQSHQRGRSAILTRSPRSEHDYPACLDWSDAAATKSLARREFVRPRALTAEADDPAAIIRLARAAGLVKSRTRRWWLGWGYLVDYFLDDLLDGFRIAELIEIK